MARPSLCPPGGCLQYFFLCQRHMKPDSRVSVLDHALVLGAPECFTIEVWLPEEEPWFLQYFSLAGLVDRELELRL